MISIPAIDIIQGKVVRLTKGEFDQQTNYDTDLVTLAKTFEDAGAERLHIIDLDAARGRAHNRDIIYEVLKATNLKVQLGGGIRSKVVLDECLDNGVAACIIGSLAVKDKEVVTQWLNTYGSDRIIIGTDVRDNFIATDGWLRTSNIGIEEFVRYYQTIGAKQFLCTDIALDGTLAGPSLALYQRLTKQFSNLHIIASGGVSSLEDLDKLSASGVSAVVIGKALLEGKIDIKKLYS